ELGTVLANDEIKDGVSERGGHPVEQKLMRQWSLRITAYAERLLQGLDRVDFSESLKEQQRNWIGKSVGASVSFRVLSPNPSPEERGAVSSSNSNAHNPVPSPEERRAEDAPNPSPEERGAVSSSNSNAHNPVPSPEERRAEDSPNPSPEERGAVSSSNSNAHNPVPSPEERRAKDSPNPSPEERGADSLANSSISSLSSSSEEKRASDTPKYMTGDPQIFHLLQEKAVQMRENPTEAEGVLWKELKGEKLEGFKFRQQHIIESFIADFVCLDRLLVVEVDGKIHNSESQKASDQERTEVLNDLGYQVIRFTNKEVTTDIEAVLLKIETTLNSRSSVKLNPAESPSLSEGFRMGEKSIEVFTTRPDTIYGVSFVVLAPEHELVAEITTDEFKAEVESYQKTAAAKSERDRMADVKNITGQNTGGFAIHPFTGEPVQVWIGDYVLATYGTGAVMAVPAGDQRDWDFATHFGIDIPAIFDGKDLSESAYTEKDAVLANSDFLNGMSAKKGIKAAIYEIEKRGIGKGKTNYRLRDAIFSRQRYWGEPFPVYYKNDLPYLLADDQLVTLPDVDKYLPTEDGEPPLARAERSAWNVFEGDRMEHNTMPGWAGSSWYFLRYMDPNNETEFASKEKMEYWNQVDLYVGGAEHAVGHLLYSRFWTKFLNDLGYISFDEPFKKLINQGMIQGRSNIIHRYKLDSDLYIPKKSINTFYIERLRAGDFTLEEVPHSGAFNKSYIQALHVDINIVENDILSLKTLQKWQPEYKNARFYQDADIYECSVEIEKMSKRWFNVQDPAILCEEHGADTLRMYEMFLGPLTDSKPWNTNGISGVNNFLKKFWRLFHEGENFSVSDTEPTKDELKILHGTIKKVQGDLERYSFNTVVSNFMIATNELGALKCNNKSVLSELVILLSPYAPHISEELWKKLGNAESVTHQQFPKLDEQHLVEDAFSYPVSFNGKMRFKIDLPTTLSKEEIEAEVMAHEKTSGYLDGKDPKKVIVVPKRIINIVV
ncbi:MAG: leucyl-tRNA synthetase, partial [Parvicellaceae bacterium]